MHMRFVRRLAVAAMAPLAGPVLAHDGHGFLGGHWHATDVWGFIGIAATAALALWFSRGGKP